MPHTKSVVFAFVTARETTQTAQLAQGLHALAPPGENFVGVRLVSNVPDDAILRRVEYVMQSNRQLHRSQVGAQMAAGCGDAL